MLNQTYGLLESLKRLLKTHGLTYRDLGNAIQLSEAAIKKAFRDQSFTLKRLEEICSVLGVSLQDLVKISSSDPTTENYPLSHQQEEELAKNEELFAFYFLLSSGLSVASIEKKYSFDEKQIERLLLKLDKMKAIRYYSRTRFSILRSLNQEWIPNGPLNRRYSRRMLQEFVDHSFTGNEESLRLAGGRLSAASLSVFIKKQDRLFREFKELVDIEQVTKSEKLYGVWVLGAVRPWFFSEIKKHLKIKK